MIGSLYPVLGAGSPGPPVDGGPEPLLNQAAEEGGEFMQAVPCIFPDGTVLIYHYLRRPWELPMPEQGRE